jgi:hydroxysqualene dehydroxylase
VNTHFSPDLIVIGGGFAGLSAATAAAERGARVLVLEARPTLGGRATAFADPASGERVDNGQHVLIGCYHETFRYLRRIGTESDVQLQRHLAIDIVDGKGRTSRLTCPVLPAPLHLVAGVMTWRALGWRDRLAVLRIRHAIGMRPGERAVTPVSGAVVARRPDCGHRDVFSMSVRDWLVELGQTPRVIELLWEPLAVAALNQRIDVAAAGPFAAVLARMFGSSRRDAVLGLPRKPLDELYAIPSREFVERRGGMVRMSAPARVHAGGRHCRVTVRGETLPVAPVVCAVPWHALADVFVDPPAALTPVLAAAAGTGASPIVTVNLWFDRPVASAAFIGLPGRTWQWAFDKRSLFGEGTSHLSLVSSGADAIVARPNQELVDLAVAELAAALPAARGALLRRAVVVREKRATFSVAPGQPARPGTVTEVPGLFLAGDWIDSGLPATIESAVVSGHWAAEAARRG